MQDHATRLVELRGFVVTDVQRMALPAAPTAGAVRCASRSARSCECATCRSRVA
jgi:hypothetical protein